jgi:hypothetical protein
MVPVLPWEYLEVRKQCRAHVQIVAFLVPVVTNICTPDFGPSNLQLDYSGTLKDIV